MSAQPLPLPVLGVDLLSSETNLTKGCVRAADNVDITNNGGFRRRGGHAVAVPGADFHSLHTYGRGTLVGRGTKVYFIDPASYTPVLLWDMGMQAPVDFTEYNEHLYFTNRGALAWLPADAMTARTVGAPLPDLLPSIAAYAAGNLLAGTYAVGLSRLDDRGEESPTALLGTVAIPTDGGGVQLTGLELDPALTARYRVYLTPADGDELYVADEFVAAFTSYIVGTAPDGAQRSTQHLTPMPPGDFVRGHAGHLYVVVGDTLWFSDAMRPHLRDERHNFIQFAGTISFIESVSGGLFVGDSRGVWFLPGNDPTQFKLTRASGRSAVRRSALRVPGTHFDPEVVQTREDVVLWLGVDGYMVGRSDGSVVALHPDRVRVAAGLEGKSAVVVRNGLRQVLTLVAASTPRTYGFAIDSSIT